MLKFCFIFIFIFTLLLVLNADSHAEITWALNNVPIDSAAHLIIRQIHILALPVFDSRQKEYQKFPYPLVNRLHFKTKNQVIARELLFQSGDHLDLALLAESERNLRALASLGRVQITAIPVNRDSVDITVECEDQWTTILGFKFDVQGGMFDYGIRLDEYNLLGSGQILKFSYSKSEGEFQRELYFFERRLARSRWQVLLHLKRYDYGNDVNFEIARPFYSERTNWAFDFNYQRYRGDRFFANPAHEFVPAYHSSDEEMTVRISHLLGRTDHRSARLSFLYYTNDQDYQALVLPPVFQFPLPSSRYVRMLGAGLDWVKLAFIQDKFIEKYWLVEDISLGWMLTGYLGKSLPEFHADNGDWYFHGKFARSAQFFKKLYFFQKYEYFTYFGSQELPQQVTQVQFKSYLKLFDLNTLVFNAALLAAWRMPLNQQIFLGESRGLRGYYNFYRAGQKRLVFNLEDRLYPKLYFYSFGIGAAIFSDIGYIWGPGATLDWQRPLVTLGFGLRIGSPKTNGAGILRFDLAWCLEPEPRFVLSFGNRHFFSAFENFNFVSPFPHKFGEVK
ncbi:hypothetical protein L0128_14815 [candidate division KSB1 bacterium]|nr:hypothetical protein [candidate division KSB1 bacterium]